MDYLLSNLKVYAKWWYESLGKVISTYFAIVLEIFCKHWYPNNMEQWIHSIQEIKEFYDSQNFVEEGLWPLLKEEDSPSSLEKDDDIVEENHEKYQSLERSHVRAIILRIFHSIFF